MNRIDLFDPTDGGTMKNRFIRKERSIITKNRNNWRYLYFLLNVICCIITVELLEHVPSVEDVVIKNGLVPYPRSVCTRRELVQSVLRG